MMGMGMGTGEKSKNFRASFGRLLGRLRPEAPLIVLVIGLAVVSVFFAILGPKILGEATNVIFDGVIGKQIPAGVTQEQAVAGLRASGQTQLADMLASMTVTPGQGVDFGALARILGLLAGVYIAQLDLLVGTGLDHGRRHPADGLPAAPRRRREARPPAAPLLRLARPRATC